MNGKKYTLVFLKWIKCGNIQHLMNTECKLSEHLESVTVWKQNRAELAYTYIKS